MIPRAVVSLGTHVVSRSDTHCHDLKIPPEMGTTNRSSLRVGPSTEWDDKCNGIFRNLVDLDVSLLPGFSRLWSEIGSMLFPAAGSTAKCEWPPRSQNMDREEWVLTSSYPILPEGSESEVALARVKYPIVHIRIPMLGLDYIKALSILSDSKQPTDELNIDDQWYLPDVDEFVDFTLDNTHTFNTI